MKKIKSIVKDLKLNEVNYYGDYIAKINFEKVNNNKNGKLILVTAMSPTPYGEGKTTVSISLADALKSLDKKVCLSLREPSMGPVFGLKGGATGGGYAKIIPENEINLHFTGDMHAITSANNLLCAAIDNHIFQGNKLDINPETICFHRCLDVNDRALRNIKLLNRTEHFQITASSEIMTILCLSKDYKDLEKKISNILIGYNFNNEPVFAKSLNVASAMTCILKEALKPNLVQTLYATPAIVHGGPFANISIGTSSIIGTKTALKIADYCITEAGFGSDLGAEKFMNIKCRYGNLKPNAIVLVVTNRALKHTGFSNLKAHIENLKLFKVPLIVTINKFADDNENDLLKIKDYCNKLNVLSEIVNPYQSNYLGSKKLATSLLNLLDSPNEFKYLYNLNEPIEEKIKILSKKIYHAKNVIYSKKALDKIKLIKEIKKENLPICVAKTQYSLSDDSKKLGNPKDYEIFVTDINLYNGAGFIVVYMGNILTLPGLPKKPAYEDIYLNEKGEIEGIF